MYMNNEISISISSLPAHYVWGRTMRSDSKSPTSGGSLGSGLWNGPWGGAACTPPVHPQPGVSGSPLGTLLAGGFMSDQPLTASDGWVGIIHGKGVGRCGMVAGDGGPESWVHATPLGTSGQASLGPLLPPVTPVKWGWQFMSAPKSSVWMQTRLGQVLASPLTCYRTSL